MIQTFSIPDKDTKDVELINAIAVHCKRKHINRSALIVSLLKTWAEQKGITNEPK